MSLAQKVKQIKRLNIKQSLGSQLCYDQELGFESSIVSWENKYFPMFISKVSVDENT